VHFDGLAENRKQVEVETLAPSLDGEEVWVEGGVELGDERVGDSRTCRFVGGKRFARERVGEVGGARGGGPHQRDENLAEG